MFARHLKSVITFFVVFASPLLWGASDDIPPSNNSLTSLLKIDSIRFGRKRKVNSIYMLLISAMIWGIHP